MIGLDRVTADGFPVHSFETLLRELGARCRNTCRIPTEPGTPMVQQLTEPTALQARAFQLFGICEQTWVLADVLGALVAVARVLRLGHQHGIRVFAHGVESLLIY